jgi:hypothetical protein
LSEDGTRPYPPHDLAPELDELDRAYATLQRENAALRARLDTVMHTGDMEHARTVSLLGAVTDLLNQLALLTRDDATYLWRIGGRPLDDAYVALKRSSAAVRPQADALLAQLAELTMANVEVAQLNGDYLIALSAAYNALQSYAYGNSAPDLAKEVAAYVLATIEKASKP